MSIIGQKLFLHTKPWWPCTLTSWPQIIKGHFLPTCTSQCLPWWWGGQCTWQCVPGWWGGWCTWQCLPGWWGGWCTWQCLPGWWGGWCTWGPGSTDTRCWPSSPCTHCVTAASHTETQVKVMFNGYQCFAGVDGVWSAIWCRRHFLIIEPLKICYPCNI